MSLDFPSPNEDRLAKLIQAGPYDSPSDTLALASYLAAHGVIAVSVNTVPRNLWVTTERAASGVIRSARNYFRMLAQGYYSPVDP
jgi:dihydrodipicolinate synthase/N-acetylneuraminate lyase